MYTIIRQVHLYSGLVLLMWVTMYFVTGAVMTHGELVPRSQPAQQTSEHALTGLTASSGEALAEALTAQLDLPGRVVSSERRPSGEWVIRLANARVSVEAVVSPPLDHARITRRTAGAVGTMHGLHRLHGYGGGWLYNLWAVVYDLASVALIVFAVTGVYLWHRLTRRRLLGWTLLSIGVGYTIAMVLYLMLAA
jgi:hypothetical protein